MESELFCNWILYSVIKSVVSAFLPHFSVVLKHYMTLRDISLTYTAGQITITIYGTQLLVFPTACAHIHKQGSHFDKCLSFPHGFAGFEAVISLCTFLANIACLLHSHNRRTLPYSGETLQFPAAANSVVKWSTTAQGPGLVMQQVGMNYALRSPESPVVPLSDAINLNLLYRDHHNISTP